LTLSIFLESLAHIASQIELIMVGKGDRTAIINHSKRKLYFSLMPVTILYLAATTVAAILYYGPYDPSNYAYDKAIYPAKNGRHVRYMAESSATDASWSIADLPISLLFIAYVFDILFTLVRKIGKVNSKKKDVRDYFVPSNIDFQIHRFGEFTMLMIGESVLSLLIVGTTEAKNYYVTECLGILTVVVIQLLKFESEPSHADNHCLWRNMNAAFYYSLLIQILSMGLIAFGTSFKVMLKTIYNYEEEDNHNGDYEEEHRSRHLAETPAIDTRISINLYCFSLVVVLVSIELMASSHMGLKKKYKLLFKHDATGHWKLRWRAILVSGTKLALLTFVATSSIWLESTIALSGVGFAVCVLFAVSKVVSPTSSLVPIVSKYRVLFLTSTLALLFVCSRRLIGVMKLTTMA
jgi:hypothetical protein